MKLYSREFCQQYSYTDVGPQIRVSLTKAFIYYYPSMVQIGSREIQHRIDSVDYLCVYNHLRDYDIIISLSPTHPPIDIQQSNKTNSQLCFLFLKVAFINLLHRDLTSVSATRKKEDAALIKRKYATVSASRSSKGLLLLPSHREKQVVITLSCCRGSQCRATLSS